MTTIFHLENFHRVATDAGLSACDTGQLNINMAVTNEAANPTTTHLVGVDRNFEVQRRRIVRHAGDGEHDVHHEQREPDDEYDEQDDTTAHEILVRFQLHLASRRFIFLLVNREH